MRKEVFKIRIDAELSELFEEYLDKVPASRRAERTFGGTYVKMAEQGYKKTISDDIKTVKENPRMYPIDNVNDLREIRTKFADYGMRFFTLDYNALQTETKSIYLSTEVKKRVQKIMKYLMTKYRLAVNEATIIRGAIFLGGLGVYEEEFGLKENAEVSEAEA